VIGTVTGAIMPGLAPRRKQRPRWAEPSIELARSMMRTSAVLAALVLGACGSAKPNAVVGMPDAAGDGDGGGAGTGATMDGAVDDYGKDSEAVDQVADSGAAPDTSDAAIDRTPSPCQPPCGFTQTCFRGLCINQVSEAVGCRMDTDPAGAAISYGCDFGLACALTPGGDFTCEPGVSADTNAMPCNGGWCGTDCACTDPTHWICTCSKPDAGDRGVDGLADAGSD
jgi:hypothetical protein